MSGGVGERAGPVPGALGILVGGYLLLLPVQLSITTTLRVAPADLFAAAGLLLLVPEGIRVRRDAFSAWHFALAAAFASGVLVTLFRQLDASRYVLLNKGVGLAVLFATYVWLVRALRSWANVRWAARLLIAGAVAQVVLGSTALALHHAAGIRLRALNWSTVRLSGMLLDPNAFGGLLVVALTLLLAGNLARPRLLGGWAGITATVVLAAGLVLTFSRSAWLGLAVVLLVVSCFEVRIALKAAAVVGLSGAALAWVSGPTLLAPLIALATRPRTIGERLDYIRIALGEFGAEPLLGVGLGFFLHRYGWIIHNTPLWVLAEMGVLGLLAFVGFLGWFAVRGLGALRRAPEGERPLVLGLLLAFLAMAGLSLGIEALYQRHWWVVMALIAVTVARTRPQAAPPASARTGVVDPGAQRGSADPTEQGGTA